MKTTILIILCAFLSISASVVTTTMVSQPATPRVVIVKPFRALYGLEDDIQQFVSKKVREGYIVKSIAMMDDETISKGIVVMEKY